MAKHTAVEVASFGLDGVHVNPKRSGGVRWTVPFAAARKAAVASGIDTYVSRLDSGSTIRLKANNRCFLPALKGFRPDDSGNSTQNDGGVVQAPAQSKTRKGGASRKATPRKKQDSKIDLSLLTKAQRRIVDNLVRMGEDAEARKLAAKFSS
jgi:hypothetical protein